VDPEYKTAPSNDAYLLKKSLRNKNIPIKAVIILNKNDNLRVIGIENPKKLRNEVIQYAKGA